MKVAIAQLDPTVGDLDGNLDSALEAARTAAERGADLVVYPAHALTGAPLEGLASSAAFVADAEAHLQRFVDACPIDALVSCITLAQQADEDLAEGDEDEFVCVPAVYIVGEGSCEVLSIPVLEDAESCSMVEIDGENIAVLLEDHVASESLLDSAELIVEMSADVFGEQTAAPAAWGAMERLEQLARGNAAFVADVNLCGAADTMVYAGNSTVTAPDGTLVYAAPVADEALFVFDTQTDAAAYDGPDADMEPCAVLWEGIVAGTRDYIRKNGFADVMVGLSGGIDSAVVAAVAADAIGAERVHAVLMPSKYSSEGSITDAQQLVRNFGMDAVTVPINEPVEAFHRVLAEPCGGAVEGLAAENLQARVRTVYLMTLSNAHGWLLLNTGNKSEAAMGFSTLYGDTAGAYAPIGDIYKTDVYALAQWRVEQGPSIPQACIDKAPSAELYPGATDQDRLPPYAQLDDLLCDHIEGNMDAAELVARGHDRAMVESVLRAVRVNEFKRRLEPMAPKVQGCSLTDDRAWPVTNGWRDASADVR